MLGTYTLKRESTNLNVSLTRGKKKLTERTFIAPSGAVSYDKDFGLFLQCKGNPLKGFMQQKDTN